MSKPNSHLRLAEDSSFQPSPEAYEKIRQMRRILEAIELGTPVDADVHQELLLVARRLHDAGAIALTESELLLTDESEVIGEGIHRKLKNLFDVYEEQADEAQGTEQRM